MWPGIRRLIAPCRKATTGSRCCGVLAQQTGANRLADRLSQEASARMASTHKEQGPHPRPGRLKNRREWRVVATTWPRKARHRAAPTVVIWTCPTSRRLCATADIGDGRAMVSEPGPISPSRVAAEEHENYMPRDTKGFGKSLAPRGSAGFEAPPPSLSAPRSQRCRGKGGSVGEAVVYGGRSAEAWGGSMPRSRERLSRTFSRSSPSSTGQAGPRGEG